MPVINTHILHR